ncbi:MAG: hypothetical protein ABIV51_13975 [Saprospiraceae bacterium]
MMPATMLYTLGLASIYLLKLRFSSAQGWPVKGLSYNLATKYFDGMGVLLLTMMVG